MLDFARAQMLGPQAHLTKHGFVRRDSSRNAVWFPRDSGVRFEHPDGT
jgi:hypothetical protein